MAAQNKRHIPAQSKTGDPIIVGAAPRGCPWVFEMNRHSIRLRDYDYSQEGAYFVTICTQNKECLFGEVSDGEVRLSDIGRMVEKWWLELANKFDSVELDAVGIMPNHLHAIILIVGADLCVCPGPGAHIGAPLHRMIQWFKTMVTNDYIHGVKNNGWHPFPGRLWQRNYYDHIIRDDESLNRIREYVMTNPLSWDLDKENPQHTGEDEFDHWLATFKTYPSR